MNLFSSATILNMSLDKDLNIILEFSNDRPNSLVRTGKRLLNYTKTDSRKFEYKSSQHKQKLKKKLSKGRLNKFSNPKTYPDKAVYTFLKSLKNYDDEKIKKVVEYHYDAMGAENILGHYLEEFINENKLDDNWVWCSGSVVDKIDFIKKEENNKQVNWKALQIKTSSNTENSSSSEVRDNTEILIWCRRNATKKDSQNWDKLRHIINSEKLTEENFLNFLKEKAKS